MPDREYQPLLHRLAVITACVAMLPIVVGALVTTMRWGMAFLDWPTSDGYGMFRFPWLASIGQADKFTEHAHRLAGALVGMAAIVLAACVFWKERRGWTQALAASILLAVVAQGLLGGLRVVRDAEVAAMVHGSLAAVVFAMMGSLALVTGRRWFDADRASRGADVQGLKPLALIAPLAIFAQYVLGGLLRHLGTALYEHLAFSAVVALLVTAASVGALRSRVELLRRPALVMLAILAVQLALGAGAFVTKFGLQSIGYVAVQHSIPQIVLRTSHTVVGMLLLAVAVVYSLLVCRLGATRSAQQRFAGITGIDPAPQTAIFAGTAREGTQ
jgi:cytochrome c oxidase assembly protein subunit 15